MTTGFYFRFVAFVFAAILCVAMVYAWRANRRDRAQLAAELTSTKQLLAAANARQHGRDAQLAQTLGALAAEKRVILTPAQIIRELPKNIPLPAPITLEADHSSSVGTTLGPPAANTSSAATLAAEEPSAGARLASPVATTSQSNQKPPAGAIIPAVDLKPLYDFTLDCQACQARLSVAQGDLADERQKTAALAKERDDAVRIAKGGSAWRRVTRAAKWFLLGAAAGAVVARAR